MRTTQSRTDECWQRLQTGISVYTKCVSIFHANIATLSGSRFVTVLLFRFHITKTQFFKFLDQLLELQ